MVKSQGRAVHRRLPATTCVAPGSRPRGSALGQLERLVAATTLSLAMLGIAWVGPTAPPASAAPSGGRVVAWGYNHTHQTDVPAEAQSDVIEIAAGCNHSLALKSSGKVLVWGDDTFHQTEVPAAAQSGVVAISAGCEFNLALKGTGEVVAWGDDTFGQTDLPALAAGFTWYAIGAGDHRSVGLIQHGSENLLSTWGEGGYANVDIATPMKDAEAGQHAYIVVNKNGTVTVGGTAPASVLTVPAGLSDAAAVDMGREHAVALRSNGTVVAWGENGFGQINVPPGLAGVHAINAGGYHTLALKSDGTVVGWGRNDFGQTTVPAPPAGFHYIAVAGGILHSLGIVAPDVPGAPTSVAAGALDGAALVSWSAPASSGGAPISGYTVTSVPDGKTCATTGDLSCTVGGLTNGTSYTFTVQASSAAGAGPASAKSNAITPTSPATPTPTATPTASPTPTPTPTPAPTPTPTATPLAASTTPASGATTSGSGPEGVLLVALGLALGLLLAMMVIAIYFGVIKPRRGGPGSRQAVPAGPATPPASGSAVGVPATPDGPEEVTLRDGSGSE